MPNKPHVQLNTKKQFDKPTKLVFNYGNPDDEDEPKSIKVGNYVQKAGLFRSYLATLVNDRQSRRAERNPAIQVAGHFEYIRITFHGQFNVNKYFQPYVNDFGLMGIEFCKFNHEILFGVVDEKKFETFLQGLQNFVNKELGINDQAVYPGKIRYIKDFELLKTSDLIRHQGDTALLNIKLAVFPLANKRAQDIYTSLKDYLTQKGLEYRQQDSNLEIYNADADQAKEIAENFDVILNVTSGLATVIRPGVLNLPERTYGFDIENPDANLPIIGILDTGVSAATPLASIIVEDADFNLTQTPFNEDNADGGQGHGTGIAALAALGKTAYARSYRGNIPADAKILSMKILDANSGFLSHLSVLQLLKAAKAKYPAIKIFVLSVCYKQHKLTNENHSVYAYELDKFAHENDCLISICTANNLRASDVNTTYNLGYFDQEETNICAPAESMNNIIVGASSHSLKNGPHVGISTSHEFPTLYTRKGHIDLRNLYPVTKINKLYFKPDIIECGGDYEFSPNGQFFGQDINASMEILSANPADSFYSNIGTSFSAPLIANTAARIQLQYPDIKSQSIKALIINGASLDNIRFDNQHSHLINKVAGHGLSDAEKSIYSSDNRITFLIEDEIEPEKLAVFPIKFPDYLVNDNLGKKQGILLVTATLCFSFDPILDNQMVYCPIHMAFCFFKNHTSEQILKKEDEINSLLKSTLRWSQNARYKAKPVAAVNTQKLKFQINKDELVDENGVFKLGVNCRILSQLLPGQSTSYEKSHAFSIAITIEENLQKKYTTNKLYQHITEVNEIINIANTELYGDLEAEA